MKDLINRITKWQNGIGEINISLHFTRLLFVVVIILLILNAIEARCKTVGGEMGYSKCYKNGKEI